MYDGMIMCAKRSVVLTSPHGEKIEVRTNTTSDTDGTVNHI